MADHLGREIDEKEKEFVVLNTILYIPFYVHTIYIIYTYYNTLYLINISKFICDNIQLLDNICRIYSSLMLASNKNVIPPTLIISIDFICFQSLFYS